MTDEMIRALQKERDAARAECERLRLGGCARGQITTQWCAEAVAMMAERDAALAREARLREALAGVIDGASPLIDYSGPGFYPVSRGEFRVEGDAIDAARAALASEAPT